MAGKTMRSQVNMCHSTQEKALYKFHVFDFNFFNFKVEYYRCSHVTTYGVVNAGDDGEVVERQFDVLTSRSSDQPRTATRPVASVTSGPRRQVASGAGHQYLTFVTPVSLLT